MELTGLIKKIGKIQIFEKSDFTKLEFVVTTEGDYPQDIAFEIYKDKADNFLKYNKVGDNVEVAFNVRGNEYKGRNFVSLNAWMVKKVDNEDSETQEEVTDDLPF